jgi:REP element-mobilizing transposase RayT
MGGPNRSGLPFVGRAVECQTGVLEKLCPKMQLTLDIPRRPPRRRKRGRPRGRKTVPHARRERFAARFPLHVTLRALDSVPRLRRGKIARVVRRAIAAAQREDFRITEFNLLGNHLHLICEAASAEALARGMQGFEVRVARNVNRLVERRGTFFRERYHARVLRTPREVRNCLAYVLHNGARHAGTRRGFIDGYSSAVWFTGWNRPPRLTEPWMRELLAEGRPTRPAASWVLAAGWKRWGPLQVDEVPAS